MLKIFEQGSRKNRVTKSNTEGNKRGKRERKRIDLNGNGSEEINKKLLRKMNNTEIEEWKVFN